MTEPGNTQNWNRYAYVYNNPLTLTDPSGFQAQPPPDGGPPGSPYPGDPIDPRCITGTGTVLNEAACNYVVGQYGSLGSTIANAMSAKIAAQYAGELGENTVQRRPTVEEFGRHLDNHIAELQALLAMDYTGQTTTTPPYTTVDGAIDMVNFVSDVVTGVQLLAGAGIVTAVPLQTLKRRTIARLIDDALLKGVTGPSGRVSAMKYLEARWDKATFASASKSIEYHIAKHAGGLNVIEYTQRASAAFADAGAVRAAVRDLMGRDAVRVISPFGTGLFTPQGKIIWFHPQL